MSIKLRNLCGIVLFLMGIHSVAFAQPIGKNPPKNLGGIIYPGKSTVSNDIKQLYLTSDSNDAYSLSIPLIASAQQGDKKTYHLILERIQVVLNKMPSDYFKAWLLGRVLLAADSIEDETTLNNTRYEFKKIITKPFDKAFSDMDYAFYAWASGYVAALNTQEYKIIRSQLLESAQNLTTVYYQTQTHEALSNAIWAWVLDLQAAAQAKDMTIYFYILNQITSMTGKTTIDEALQYALERTETSSDYPAWALGIVELSAANIQDKLLYTKLQEPLQNSINGAIQFGNKPNQTPANQWKAKAEATLGQLNYILAKVRLE